MINLGVGVVFESLDKGLKRDMVFLNKSFIQAKKSIDALQKSADALNIDSVEPNSDTNKGLDQLNKKFDDLNEKLVDTDKITKKGKKSLTDMGNSLLTTFASIATGMVTQSGILKDTLMGKFEINQLAKDMDNVRTQFKLIGDNKSAVVFMNNMYKGMQDFGVSAAQMNDIFTSLSQYTMDTTELNKSFEYTNKLVGGLKMNAAEVADMFGRASNTFGLMPEQMFKAVGEANRLGTAFGMINFGQDIPGMFEQATKNAMMLGDTSKGSVLEATNSISKLAVSFKSAGFSSKEAVASSKAFSGHLSKMSLDIKKMNLGLGYNAELMNSIGKASSFAGVGFDELTADIQKNDPDMMIQKYGKKIEDLKKQGMTAQAEQLRFSLGDLLGDDAFNALGNVGKMQKNLAKGNAKAKALSPGDKLIDEQIAINRSSLDMSQKIVDSNKELIAATVDLAGKTSIVAASFDQAKIYQNATANAATGTQTEPRMIELTGLSKFFGVDMSSAIYKLLDNVQSLGKAFMVVAAGLGVFKFPSIARSIGGSGVSGGAAKGVAKAAQVASGAGEAAAGVEAGAAGAEAVGATASVASKGLGFLKIAGKVAAPLTFAIQQIHDIIDSFGDFEKKGLMGGIATILFGKSQDTKIGDTLSKTIGQGFKFAAIGAIGGPIGAGIGAIVGIVASLLKDSFTMGFENTFNDLMSGTGRFVGKIVDFISNIFSAENMKMVGTAIWNGIKSIGTVIGGIGEFVSNLVMHPLDMLNKVIDGMLNAASSAAGFITKVIGSFASGFSNSNKPTETSPSQTTPKTYQSPDYQVPTTPLVLNPNASAAVPVPSQSGAPAGAALGSNYQPTMATTGSQDSIGKKLDDLNSNLMQLTASNINVNIVGDIKKFLSAVTSVDRQRAAVGPSSQAMMPAGTAG